MQEIREMVKAYLKATGYTQAKLCKEINETREYRVNPGEMSLALSGSLESPKAVRILEDSAEILRKVAKRQAESVKA